MANGVFNRGKFRVANDDMDNVVLKLMLVSTGYIFDADHNTISDAGATTTPPINYEISVGGYARQTLTGLANFQDNTNDFAGLDAADVVYTALAAGQTVGGAVLSRYATSSGPASTGTTGDSGQELIAFYDVTDTPTNGGDITIQFASTSAGSVLKFGTTS